MNRREMLTAGFRHLAQALPGLITTRSLSALWRSAAPAPPRRPALSFPQKVYEAADPAQQSLIKED